MRFSIRHQTRYEYTEPVFLEPHVVRLIPRCGPTQHLHRFDLTIDPAPVGRVSGLDAENNAFTQIWFEGRHTRLELCTEADVETLCRNPFAGLLTHNAERLPLTLPDDLRTQLSPYLHTVDDTLLHDWVRETMNGPGHDTLTFLSRLCSELYARTTRVRRIEPGIQPVGLTLETGRGACRDLTVVFIEACRSVGIPARFVSGYQQVGDDESYRDLHAWAEVFLPGFGWRGYDPAQGLAVADDHVALSATARADQAAPVTGTIRGKAQSNVNYWIDIDTMK